jgi:hypothetical protein
MEGTDYNKKKILQLYVVEWKQHSKWDVTLFKGLLHTMAHNFGVSAIRHGDYEISRFQLTKATAERHGPSLPHLMSGHL